MKMTVDEIKKVQTMLSMQSVQNYGRMTVWSLMRHIEALEWEIESVVKAGEDIVNSRLESLDQALSEKAKHARTILMLQREKKRLEEEVDEVRKGNKVSVPQAVATAYESLRRDCESVDAGVVAFNIMSLTPSHLTENAQVIKRYFSGSPSELMKFFVNGYYTVERPQDRISAKIAELLDEMNVQTPISADKLARQLVDVIQESLAEQQQTTI